MVVSKSGIVQDSAFTESDMRYQGYYRSVAHYRRCASSGQEEAQSLADFPTTHSRISAKIIKLTCLSICLLQEYI